MVDSGLDTDEPMSVSPISHHRPRLDHRRGLGTADAARRSRKGKPPCACDKGADSVTSRHIVIVLTSRRGAASVAPFFLAAHVLTVLWFDYQTKPGRVTSSTVGRQTLAGAIRLAGCGHEGRRASRRASKRRTPGTLAAFAPSMRPGFPGPAHGDRSWGHIAAAQPNVGTETGVCRTTARGGPTSVGRWGARGRAYRSAVVGRESTVRYAFPLQETGRAGECGWAPRRQVPEPRRARCRGSKARRGAHGPAEATARTA
jgi:hypothetical protein